ncbi:unnamed protein product [Mortierella alpina]
MHKCNHTEAAREKRAALPETTLATTDSLLLDSGLVDTATGTVTASIPPTVGADALVSLSLVDDEAAGRLPRRNRLQVIQDGVEQTVCAWNNKKQDDSNCSTGEKQIEGRYYFDQDLSGSQQRLPTQLSAGKSSRRLLRVISGMALVLVILFSVAVLNLFAGWATASSPSASMASFGNSLRQILREDEALIAGSAPVSSVSSSSSFSTIRNVKTSVDELESQLPSHQSRTFKPRGRPQLPPQAKRIPRPMTLHNETLLDNYRWMHHIDRDPDVQKYIRKESEYTAAWVQQSGVAAIQKQLENEMQQIRNAMYRQTSHSSHSDGLVESEDASSTTKPRSKPRVERLEDTQFWDIDRWRYWLDTSVGDYGVYKRRLIPRDPYQHTGEESRRSSMLSTSSPGDSPFTRYPAQDVFSLPQHSSGETVYAGGCSAKRSPTPVQVVLDINRLVEKHGRKDEAGGFSFGSIEIQPKSTALELDMENRSKDSARGLAGDSKGDGKRRHDDPSSENLFLAFSYDISGDERYRIHIRPLASLSSPEDPESPTFKTDSRDSAHLSVNLQDGLVSINGAVIKNAGPEMRWAKLSESLYLYFTRLDPKGLAREVWRVKVQSLEGVGTETRGSQGEAMRQTYEPEMVMQEKDQRNVLGISFTNDQRFLLIQSIGETSTCTYFLSIDSPDKGWNLVRQAEENVIYNVEHHSGYFYIRTNHGGALNFKAIRIPVEYSSENHPACAPRTPSRGSCTSSFLKDNSSDDELVIAYNAEEYIERIEVFVEHIVAWIWRAGLQEVRIFAAPRPGEVETELPLKELQRLRPYDKEFKIATVMPGNIRDEEQRLMRDFYSTKLLYSNCSFVHPWALYEFDMHSLTPLPIAALEDDEEARLRNATRLVCRDPFPVGIRYGHSKEQHLSTRDLHKEFELSLQDARLEDSTQEQEKEMAKFKEMRIMVPSTHGSRKNLSLTTNNSSDDGGETSKVMIPVSLVYYSLPDNLQFPRKAAFVQAYGAYGTLTAPKFDPVVILPLLHRGFIYVVVHPRGDGVMGREWYADGKQENKINTFYDVEDVLLHLRDSGMVQEEAVVIEGRSAGGLVSGWMANRWGEIEAPTPGSLIDGSGKTKKKNIVGEMVKAVLAQVPFVDVIADMSDPDIPWVEYEWAEWGSPLESREVFEVMKRYSPYDRIRNQPYPAMMVMGGLSDGRVSYAEPLKFVAKMRSVDGKTNDCEPSEGDKEEAQNDGALTKDKGMCAGRRETPLLLQMEEGGHFSGNSSLWMAFAIHQLGVEKVVTGASSDD